jgi:hypothetical protein
MAISSIIMKIFLPVIDGLSIILKSILFVSVTVHNLAHNFFSVKYLDVVAYIEAI